MNLLELCTNRMNIPSVLSILKDSFLLSESHKGPIRVLRSSDTDQHHKMELKVIESKCDSYSVDSWSH